MTSLTAWLLFSARYMYVWLPGFQGRVLVKYMNLDAYSYIVKMSRRYIWTTS